MSAGAGAVGDRVFGDGQAGGDAVGEAQVEQHSLGGQAGHLSGLEVDDEEGLAADELLKVLPLSLHTRQDHARVVAEVNGEAYGGRRGQPCASCIS